MQWQINLDNAYRVHIFCKESLLDSLANSAPEDVVKLVASHNYELGEWLSGEAARLYEGHPREYQSLLSRYQQFYSIAEIQARIVSQNALVNLHRELLTSPHFSRASLEIGIAINELKSAIRLTDIKRN